MYRHLVSQTTLIFQHCKRLKPPDHHILTKDDDLPVAYDCLPISPLGDDVWNQLISGKVEDKKQTECIFQRKKVDIPIDHSKGGGQEGLDRLEVEVTADQ